MRINCGSMKSMPKLHHRPKYVDNTQHSMAEMLKTNSSIEVRLRIQGHNISGEYGWGFAKFRAGFNNFSRMGKGRCLIVHCASAVSIVKYAPR